MNLMRSSKRAANEEAKSREKHPFCQSLPFWKRSEVQRDVNLRRMYYRETAAQKRMIQSWGL